MTPKIISDEGICGDRSPTFGSGPQAICRLGHGHSSAWHEDDSEPSPQRWTHGWDAPKVNESEAALAADAVYQRGFDHGRHRSAEDVVEFAEVFRGHTRDILLQAARVALNGPEAALSAPSEPAAKITELRAELESANERIKALLGQRDKAGHLVADLVRADNNRCGSGPGGRINAGDTLPLQLLLGLSLTIRDMFEGTQFDAPATPSEPVPDSPRVWAGPGCCRAAYESDGHAHDHAHDRPRVETYDDAIQALLAVPSHETHVAVDWLEARRDGREPELATTPRVWAMPELPEDVSTVRALVDGVHAVDVAAAEERGYARAIADLRTRADQERVENPDNPTMWAVFLAAADYLESIAPGRTTP